MKLFKPFLFLAVSFTFLGEALDMVKKEESPVIIKIILGSTRTARFSEQLGSALKEIVVATLPQMRVEIADLREYKLPFLNDETVPMMRTEITDPEIQRWSDAIAQADAFIIVTPEYNSGYPGVLKNALDILYKEWNDKPVAFVGYSGGSSGGSHAIAQLKEVVSILQMVPIATTITIPASYKLKSNSTLLLAPELKEQFLCMINELMIAVKQ